MTGGEWAYLSLVLVFFVAFLVIVGAGSMTERRRDRD